MKDYIVRATAAEGQVRAFSAPGCDSGTGKITDSRSDDGKHDEK